MEQTIIDLEIERMSYGPAAVGRYTAPGAERAVVIFVEGAAPGDLIRARVLKRHKNYWEAEVTEVLRPSPERAAPPCPVFGKCGGCQWQHLEYELQVKSKKEILLHQLRRVLPGGEDLIQVHPAPNPWGYRNRIQVRGDNRGLGFYAKDSHDLVHVDYCRISDPEIQKAWRDFVQTRPLGELAKNRGQFKVEWVRTETGQVMEAMNREHAALGFTQANSPQNKVLIELTARLAQKGEVLFDLYGGDGNLSLGLREKFKKIFCVEAFGAGKAPAGLKEEDLSGFTHVRSEVAEFLQERPWEAWGVSKVDCVIADPPRSGLKDVVPHLLKLGAPRLVLVSCDPSTLSRDLGVLLPAYRIDEIHFVDMFPQTYHIEAVVSLTRVSPE